MRPSEKWDLFIRITYNVGMMLMIVMLVAVAFGDKVSVYNTRTGSKTKVVKDYQYEKLQDEESPTGIVKVFTFKKLENVTDYNSCLTFFMVHHYVRVYIDDELVYELKPADDNLVGHTVGNNWVVVPLTSHDAGKKLRIEMRPVYKGLIGRVPEFYQGTYTTIYRQIMQRSIVYIVIGVLLCAIGIAFFIISIMHMTRGSSSARRVYYLGLFGVVVGVWRIFDTPFSAFVFPDNTIFCAYLALATLLISCVPLNIVFKEVVNKEKHYILPFVNVIFSLWAIIAFVLQMFDIRDIRDILIFNHIEIIVSAFAILISVIDYVVHEEEREKFVHLAPIAVFGTLCIIADMVGYYIKGNTNNTVLTMFAFFFAVLLAGIRSVRKLNRKAHIDRRTGLNNRNSCEEMLSQNIKADKTSLLVFDLNNLKKTNDEKGHEAGDKLIENFAFILKNNMPASAFLGRYGGDEFIAILEDTDKDRIDFFLTAMEQATIVLNAENDGPEVSYAVGVAFADDDMRNAKFRKLFKIADDKMYEDKKEYHKSKDNKE